MTTQSQLPAVPAEPIAPLILSLRDQRVILDADLARVYGVETRALNQAMKRNQDRFPADFMFDLAREEILRISDYGLCENACATSDAYKLKDFIEEEPKDANQNEYLRIINTGTIGKFLSKWGRREMVYLGNRYSRPMVHKKKFLAAFKNSYGQKATKQKLIVKGLNLLDACLDLQGTTIPGKTTLMVTSGKTETLKLLVALLNSSVAFFYLKEKYPASSYNQGTTFTKDMINDLPIPELKLTAQAELVSCVDQILSAKQRHAEADTSTLEREIDETVCALYGLTRDEATIVKDIAR